MSKHTKVRLSLYDYLDGTLSEQERMAIEEHLRSCDSCNADLHRMREALSLVARPERPASEARSGEFWASFATAVEGRIQERQRKKTRLADVWDTMHSYLFFHRGSFALAGMAAAIVLLVIVLTHQPAPTREVVFIDSSKSSPVPLEPRHQPAQRVDQLDLAEHPSRDKGTASVIETPLRVRYADTRMSQYLRKSKVLLIGIANLKTEEGQPVDLSVEQRASRELVREARYLKQRPLDPRVDELVDAMSRILIELANISKDKQIPNMEIVRSGIHQENLLFKIRMAETVFDSAHFVYAKGTQQ